MSIEEANRVAEEYFWTACKIGRNYRRLAVDVDEAVEIALFTLVEESRSHSPEKGPFEPYLQRAIRNAIISEYHKRTAGNRPQGVISLDAPISPDGNLTLMDCVAADFSLVDTETAVDMSEAVKQFDGTTQEALSLMADGHSAKSAAHELGVSASALYRRTAKARPAIRNALAMST